MRFVSTAGEAALRIGDVCQMAESIAFFEAYRPVLEGLQSMSYGKFPLQVNYHHNKNSSDKVQTAFWRVEMLFRSTFLLVIMLV